MARNNNQMLQLAALSALGFVVYQAIPESERQKLRHSWDGLVHGGVASATPPKASAPSSNSGCEAGWHAVQLADSGGFPLEVKGNQIRQRCSNGGTNSYGSNDVFQVLGAEGMPTGQWVHFLGACHFVAADDGSTVVDVGGC